ncbi:MAG: MmcQ/YjbR family DNA-binding protein [Candidatus Sericytochromatia bacterium]
MDYTHLRTYCLSLNGAEETWPFGPEVTVFKLAGKMFALCNPAQAPLRINLKCEPNLAQLLRENYAAVQPGWHMNKRHWNTVTLHSDLPETEVYKQISHSYALIKASLPKHIRDSLKD